MAAGADPRVRKTSSSKRHVISDAARWRDRSWLRIAELTGRYRLYAMR
jgi:hypothetical protein